MATTSRRTGTTTLRTLTIFPSQGCRGRRKRYPKQALAVKFRKGRELRLFELRSAADQRRIDVVLLRLGVNEVAERHRVGEELLADGHVDPLHLAMEHVLRLRLSLFGWRRNVGQPGVVEKANTLRDQAVRQRARQFEK